MWPRIVIIADDLTGAADAAGGVAAEGLVTLLCLETVSSTPADALAFTTESRGLSPQHAVRRVRALARRLREVGILSNARVVYKKIDSTLRGHPSAELAALMEEAGVDRALVAPAFPAQSRTTIDGRQLVGGVPLEQTEFGRESTASDLRAVFESSGFAVMLLCLKDVRTVGERLELRPSSDRSVCWIADAETDEDLNRLASASGDLRLFCGSAGFLSALREVSRWSSRFSAPEYPPVGRGPGLIVTGSRHRRTREQVQSLRTQGVLVWEVGDGPTAGHSAGADLVGQASRALAVGRDVVLTSPPGEGGPMRPQVACFLASLCRRVASRSKPAFLVVTGGDTAGHLFRDLHVSAIRILGEISPGMPHGRLHGGLLSGLPVATKAGGFGEVNALSSVLQFFRNLATAT